ncbi:dipeptidase PepE [Glaciecola sp. MH2013]|uniref:dipeptidase PepE n=1 Tax=Glaciecola sp. MH2013 TaxID=2785524 RepID=UPI00189F1A37|nr:dipeptidase PepE [Glaciecola sp. MH2013]MBF7073171.1 dipeptidase PepE [Glaciecola sp. MH2013]
MLQLAKVLMLSSSRKGDEAYLGHAKSMIATHLKGVKKVVFIPYAGVSISWDEYTSKVQEALPQFDITGIHTADKPNLALENTEAVMVGGGNTFRLLHELYRRDVFKTLQDRVSHGLPYVGWSAGSNICGNSIKTTNDMPIIEPASFSALGFINAQLNPHYSNYVAPGHNGETRDQRIAEFCALYPDVPVIGIQEGSALLRDKGKLSLLGDLDATIFIGTNKLSIDSASDLTAYL